MARKRHQSALLPQAESEGQEELRGHLRGLDQDLRWIDRVRSKLLAWSTESGRDLPWRAIHDPYRVLVSEMMLIQTTVAAVVPFYTRFLERFPTLAALAEADEADVLKAWEGLGYYRRARQLQAAAQAVMNDHAGVFPSDPEAVRALPGVGRYIAGAILSFAFDQAAPIVEANTQRVLARWLAWPEELTTSRSQSRLWEAATRLVPPTAPGQFNQAFMDLGALICVPRMPLCLTCPVADECEARRLGQQDRLPVARVRKPPKEVAEVCLLVERDGRYLILRRGLGRLWENFWEFPTLHQGGADPAGRALGEAMPLAEGLERLTGIRAEVGPPAHTVRFGVTTHQVTLAVHPARWLAGEARVPDGWTAAEWVAPSDLGGFTLGSATRRVVRWLIDHSIESGLLGSFSNEDQAPVSTSGPDRPRPE